LHINETTGSILTKFRTAIETTKRPSWWSKYVYNKFKMAERRHLEKRSQNRNITATVIAIWTQFGVMMQTDPPISVDR